MPGDEVITPVVTCTATTIPFLYMGVKFRFATVEDVEYVCNTIRKGW
jgi:dTDP-4-amino-4,6-dideoxygalactose transaminase